jgi:hypothetical protein
LDGRKILILLGRRIKVQNAIDWREKRLRSVILVSGAGVLLVDDELSWLIKIKLEERIGLLFLLIFILSQNYQKLFLLLLFWKLIRILHFRVLRRKLNLRRSHD